MGEFLTDLVAVLNDDIQRGFIDTEEDQICPATIDCGCGAFDLLQEREVDESLFVETRGDVEVVCDLPIVIPTPVVDHGAEIRQEVATYNWGMINDKVRKRLEQEEVIWLTTIREDGQPQSSVVWFLLEGDELLIYSKRGTIRNENVVSHPKVSLNLNSTPQGGGVVTLEGTARIDMDAPKASQNPPYLGKYLERIESYNWTPDSFSSDYPLPIRIKVERVRKW